MEGATSEQGARPKTVPTGIYRTGYGQFRLKLESLIIRQHACTLATWFEFPAETTDKISRSDFPSRDLVQCMNDRDIINPTDISELIEALEHEDIGLKGVAKTVKEAFELYLPIVQSSPVTNVIHPRDHIGATVAAEHEVFPYAAVSTLPPVVELSTTLARKAKSDHHQSPDSLQL